MQLRRQQKSHQTYAEERQTDEETTPDESSDPQSNLQSEEDHSESESGDDSGRLDCDHCSNNFANSLHLKHHQRLKKCQNCDLSFKCVVALEEHDKTTFHECEFCGKKVKHGRKEEFLAHKSNGLCDACGATFACQTRLTQHLIRSERCRNNEGPVKNDGKKLICQFCKKFIRGDDQMSAHLADIECKGCRKKFTCASIRASHQSKKKCGKVEKKKDKKFQCLCNRAFDSEFSLKVHQSKTICGLNKSSAVKSKFICKFCTFPLSNADKLRRHQIKNKCPQCGSFVGCCRSVSSHVLSCVQSGTRGVQGRPNPPCYICGQHFRSLEWHQKARHVCKKCGEEMACYGQLRNHRKICKMCPGCKEVKPTLSHRIRRNCAKCGASMKCVVLFRKHQCFSEKCQFCGTVCRSTLSKCPKCFFLQPCDVLLQNHLNVCKFEASLILQECNWCNEKCRLGAELAAHILKMHFDSVKIAKVMTCEFCQKDFFQRVVLETHLKNEHLVQNDENVENIDDFEGQVDGEEATSVPPREENHIMSAVKEETADVEVLNEICASVHLKNEAFIPA